MAKRWMIAVALSAIALAGTWGYGQQAAPAKPAHCVALEQDLFIDLKEVVKAGCTPSPAQLSKLLENPVANFVSLPLQYDYITLEGGHISETKAMQRLQIIPTFPISLGSNWNLINRVVFPLLSVPFNKGFGDCIGTSASEILSCPSLPGALENPFERTSGFGDIAYVGAIAPKKSTKIESTGAYLSGAPGSLRCSRRPPRKCWGPASTASGPPEWSLTWAEMDGGRLSAALVVCWRRW